MRFRPLVFAHYHTYLKNNLKSNIIFPKEALYFHNIEEISRWPHYTGFKCYNKFFLIFLKCIYAYIHIVRNDFISMTLFLNVKFSIYLPLYIIFLCSCLEQTWNSHLIIFQHIAYPFAFIQIR